MHDIEAEMRIRDLEQKVKWLMEAMKTHEHSYSTKGETPSCGCCPANYYTETTDKPSYLPVEDFIAY